MAVTFLLWHKYECLNMISNILVVPRSYRMRQVGLCFMISVAYLASRSGKVGEYNSSSCIGRYDGYVSIVPASPVGMAPDNGSLSALQRHGSFTERVRKSYNPRQPALFTLLLPTSFINTHFS